MDQEKSPSFSSGLELANLIVTSDLLEHSWRAISQVQIQFQNQTSGIGMRFGHYNERPNCKIIAFAGSPTSSETPFQGEGRDLVSFSSIKTVFPVFEFLCSKRNPDFSMNGAALNIFQYLFVVFEQEISRLKSNPNPQLIITGHALGGSIASLFTLLLLDSLNLKKTKLLCITFGSPLVGDEGLQMAIKGFSAWNSFFLHVVSNQDPLPRIFLKPSGYYPFGTFLLCSAAGCACYEDPDSILELLNVTKSNTFANLQLFDYKGTVDHLKGLANCRVTPTNLITNLTSSLQGSFIAQLETLGVVNGQAQQQPNNIVNRLTAILTEGETNLMLEKTQVFDPSKTLNDSKINMANLEWYKKTCKARDIGYYDSYKKKLTEPDIKVAEFKEKLKVYWENVVAEVEWKPMKEGASLRNRWLFGGNNYRRMVEPLDIAEHYRKGLVDYLSQRPKHYIKLEEWLGKGSSEAADQAKKESVSSILTEDSCFWAYVEEALIACRELEQMEPGTEESDTTLAKLAHFEDYVVGLMRNYAVSPEIFLTHSSFMTWWKEYNEIMGDGHDTILTRLMRNEDNYHLYGKGELHIH